MSQLAGPVLVGALLVSSPSLWGAFVDGTTTTETALVRFLVALALGWAAVGVVSMLVGPVAGPPPPLAPPADPETVALDAD